MATFVLVHGAWHGGWCWRRLLPLLRSAGHEACTPTLTGLGERANRHTPATDLATHIQDVVGVPEFEEPRDVALVGHSYGGLVIAGVAARVPERVAHLVYLDAFVPGDGQALLDLLPPLVAVGTREPSQREGDGIRIPPTPGNTFGVTAPGMPPGLSRSSRPSPWQPSPSPRASILTTARGLRGHLSSAGPPISSPGLASRRGSGRDGAIANSTPATTR